MKGYTSRVQAGNTASSEPPTLETSISAAESLEGELVALQPVWEAVSFTAAPLFPAAAEHGCIIGGTPVDQKAVQDLYPQAGWLDIEQIRSQCT